MKAASGLVSARQASPELAAQAVRQALAAAGLERASGVCLFLSREFDRLAPAAVLAAARAAGSLQVFGCTASGLFTENGWLLDQPGAAAMVFEQAPAAPATPATCLAFSGQGSLPFDWHDAPPRIGLLDSTATTWANARTSSAARSETRLAGIHTHLVLATGLRRLGPPQTVTLSRGLDLCQLAGQSALSHLQRSLPAELRAAPPWHQIVALRSDDAPGIAILATHADGSLSLAEELPAGSEIAWAIRQPLAAEEEMRSKLRAAVDAGSRPDFALLFSCIGRGPLFYGNDDRDLLACREQFPGLPLLGAYGTGQIAPQGGGNRLFQNSVITLLCEGAHAV